MTSNTGRSCDNRGRCHGQCSKEDRSTGGCWRMSGDHLCRTSLGCGGMR